MIRILVVEDSPTARALLVEMISQAEDLRVVGEAKNGIEGIEMARQLRPDLITMDIQMPGLDGFEATKRIMVECPTPIVLISSLNVTDVQISMDALRAGALAVLPKPAGPASPDYEQSCRHLAVTIRTMARVRLVRRKAERLPGSPTPAVSSPPPRPEASAEAPRLSVPTRPRPRVIAMAASTGGPAAYFRILSELPESWPLPVLLVQHIAHGFSDGFAKWLDEGTALRVKVALNGESLRPGTVYLAPDDHHLTVSERSTVVLTKEAPVHGFRPSGTTLFESVARVYGASAVGVILTGMGNDGVSGLKNLKTAGGLVVAQDEASCDIFGMPAAAIKAKCVDVVLPLTLISAHLRSLV